MGITPVIHQACLRVGLQFWKALPDCRQRDRDRSPSCARVTRVGGEPAVAGAHTFAFTNSEERLNVARARAEALLQKLADRK